MKKHILSFILISIFIGYSYGQDSCLKVADFSAYDYAFKKFYGKINPSLADRMGDQPLVRFVGSPGGDIISIENDSLGIPTLISHSYEFKIILYHIALKPKIKEYKVPISPVLSEMIRKLIVAAIQKDYKDQGNLINLDGTEYYFLVKNEEGKQMLGSTYSPSKGSNMYELLSVFFELDSMARGKKTNTEKLKKRIILLTRNLS
jgi:hypothetical protein